jgi:hypothetical protein
MDPFISPPIILHHNLKPQSFMWLWAKYVIAPQLTKHCTACLKSLSITHQNGRNAPYSQRFSRASNPEMAAQNRLVMDENQGRPFAAIYLCGVSASGYSQKRNYPHNLHTAIVAAPGETDTFRFENWELTVENGLFTRIPERGELSSQFDQLPDPYTSCRIFRWAACVLPALIDRADGKMES